MSAPNDPPLPPRPDDVPAPGPDHPPERALESLAGSPSAGPKAPASARAAETGEPELSPEDSGSQALAGALRSSFVIVKGIMFTLMIVFLVSGMKIVGPQEQAILLRFGKPVGQGAKALLGPGLHWAFPYPIDEIVRVPIGQVQTISSSIGWYATLAGLAATGIEPPPGDSLNPAIDGYTITADQNIIHVRADLRYRVADAVRYVFGFSAASNTVQNALNNSLVFASARYTVDNALIRDLTGFQETVQARLDQLIGEQGLGIQIDQLNLKSIPPRKLKDAFDAVANAAGNAGKELKEAQTYANQATNRARGEADIRINAGENDRTRLVATIGEESRRFSKLLPAFQRNPEFFLRQQQLESLQRVLTNGLEKIVMTERADHKARELRIQINRELPKPKFLEAPKSEDDH